MDPRRRSPLPPPSRKFTAITRAFGILTAYVLITYWVKYKGTRFPIRRGETILGRSPYCSIVITDDLVSREHCALRLTNQGLMVTDLNSTNGLRLNGEPLRGESALKAGDILNVGTAALEVMEVDASVRSRARRTTKSPLDEPAAHAEVSTPTRVHANTLDLIETLLDGSPEGDQLRAVGVTVSRTLNELLGGLEADQRRHGSTPAAAETGAALAGFARRTAGLFPDGSYAEWLEQFLGRIEELSA